MKDARTPGSRRSLWLTALIAYGVFLVVVMIFKALPAVRVGGMIFNFGGTATGPANLVPFSSIMPYLLGRRGAIATAINLIGNVAILVPVGLLVPVVFPRLSWWKKLAVAIMPGLFVELTQLTFGLGIFDVDDVLLNTLGVLLGYGIHAMFARRHRFGKDEERVTPSSL